MRVTYISMRLFLFCVLLAAGFASTEALRDWFRRTFGACRNDEVENAPARERDSACEAKADRGECSFYDCFEERYPCGECGFARDYAMYNCERFTNPRFYNNFNSQGRQWVNNTGRCLTKKMKTLYERPSLSCRETKTYMLGVISDCYVQSGFCDIMIGNARALVDVYEVDNFLQSIGVFREVFQIASHCAEGVAQRFVQEMTRLLGDQFTFHG